MRTNFETFQGLDAIYAQLRPKHASHKRPAELEPDAPAQLRRLWEATGVSEATGSFRTRAESEEELAKIFRDWATAPVNRRVWGPDEAAFRKALPERVRLLRVGESDVLVSDESGTDADPPVLLMRADEGPVIRYHDKYSEWQIWRGLGIAASIREASYEPTGKIRGEQILENAYPPGLYAIADGIWWLHMPPLASEAGVPVNPCPLIYASAKAYLEFIFGLPEDEQACFSMPKSSVFVVKNSGPIKLSKGAPQGFRVSNRVGYLGPKGPLGPTGWFQAIGPVGDTIVWLGMREKSELTVGFDPGAREQVRAWLVGLGVKITREEPLRTTSRTGVPRAHGWGEESAAESSHGTATAGVSAGGRERPAARAGDPALEAAIASEAERLAALLTKNVPAPREPINLPESDPKALRVFWRAIGWNRKWPERYRLHHPDFEQSARKLPTLLEQLVEESPSSPALKSGALPQAFRVADVDRDGVGFVLTNEDDPEHCDNPPLVGVVFDTGGIFAPPISYLNWCADELIAASFSGWLHEFVTPAEIPGVAAETPFPILSPTTRIFAPEVWLLPADAYARPGADRQVAFATPEAFRSVFGRPPKTRRR